MGGRHRRGLWVDYSISKWAISGVCVSACVNVCERSIRNLKNRSVGVLVLFYVCVCLYVYN